MISGRPWSEAEDDTIRSDYAKLTAATVATQLGRSVAAVCNRAMRLGVSRIRKWSKKDDHDLRDAWGEGTVERIARRLKRSPHSVYWRAGFLGLPRGCPEGFEYLSTAADRVGLDRKTLVKILKAAGVKIGRSMSRPKKEASFRCRVVDPYAVDKAVRQYRAVAPINTYADSAGIDLLTLQRWALLAEANGVVTLPPRPTRKRYRWNVPGATMAKVLAWRASLETVSAGAKRVGLNRETLRARLAAAGVVPLMVGRTWWVPLAAVDSCR